LTYNAYSIGNQKYYPGYEVYVLSPSNDGNSTRYIIGATEAYQATTNKEEHKEPYVELFAPGHNEVKNTITLGAGKSVTLLAYLRDTNGVIIGSGVTYAWYKQ
jgi:hypothetical protein